MNILLNGQSHPIKPQTTVTDLLAQLKLAGPLAVEINREVCPKKLHGQTTLSDGDELEVVTIVGGG